MKTKVKTHRLEYNLNPLNIDLATASIGYYSLQGRIYQDMIQNSMDIRDAQSIKQVEDEIKSENT